MKGDDIASRLLDLAVACLRLAAEIETNVIGKHIARQLIRSSTSGGANYEEARSAASSADFAHKVAIAGKEVGETVYWLRLATRAGLSSTNALTPWMDEGLQLVRILAASARTAKGRAVSIHTAAGA
jgi:four helix bundle protein